MCNLTDELGKAHMGPLFESGQILQVGPLECAEAAINGFAWAHYFSYGALSMHPDGPISFI
jgi:hypothetical protein